MVSFQCDGCQDVVKKPKLDNHSYKCHASFTCVDCSKTFNGSKEWKSHTSCMTEEEKYQKSLYKGPKGGQKNNAKSDQQQKPKPDEAKEKENAVIPSAGKFDDIQDPSSSKPSPSTLSERGWGRGGSSIGRSRTYGEAVSTVGAPSDHSGRGRGRGRGGSAPFGHRSPFVPYSRRSMATGANDTPLGTPVRILSPRESLPPSTGVEASLEAAQTHTANSLPVNSPAKNGVAVKEKGHKKEKEEKRKRKADDQVDEAGDAKSGGDGSAVRPADDPSNPPVTSSGEKDDDIVKQPTKEKKKKRKSFAPELPPTESAGEHDATASVEPTEGTLIEEAGSGSGKRKKSKSKTKTNPAKPSEPDSVSAAGPSEIKAKKQTKRDLASDTLAHDIAKSEETTAPTYQGSSVSEVTRSDSSRKHKKKRSNDDTEEAPSAEAIEPKKSKKRKHSEEDKAMRVVDGDRMHVDSQTTTTTEKKHKNKQRRDKKS